MRTLNFHQSRAAQVLPLDGEPSVLAGVNQMWSHVPDLWWRIPGGQYAQPISLPGQRVLTRLERNVVDDAVCHDGDRGPGLRAIAGYMFVRSDEHPLRPAGIRKVAG